MSKELIEQLRELSANRKPYATGAHGQIIGMESYRIVANGFALECIDEAADRIEELEGANTLNRNALRLQKEKCDALQADNARLRDALEDSYMTNPCDTHSQQAAFDKAQSALCATHEQSLAEYRNKVIEAFVNEFSRHVGGDGEFWLHELQDFAMKEQP